jgi:hypothetical protein
MKLSSKKPVEPTKPILSLIFNLDKKSNDIYFLENPLFLSSIIAVVIFFLSAII